MIKQSLHELRTSTGRVNKGCSSLHFGVEGPSPTPAWPGTVPADAETVPDSAEAGTQTEPAGAG